MIIYCIQNCINDKVYVGQTVKPLAKRWAQHRQECRGSRICAAVSKYGQRNFEISILSTSAIKSSLDNLERVWIILLQSTHKTFGYNVAVGGSAPPTRTTPCTVCGASVTYCSWRVAKYCKECYVTQRNARVMARRRARGMPPDRLFDGDIASLYQRHSEGVSINALSKELGFSRETITRAFRNAGLTVHNFPEAIKRAASTGGKRRWELHKYPIPGGGRRYAELYGSPGTAESRSRGGRKSIGVPGDSESRKRGRIKASHNRWHVKRGINNPACAFCLEIS
jgi:hypothetical protein